MPESSRPTRVTDPYRTCTTCGATLPNTQEHFHIANRYSGQLRPDCIPCHRTKHREAKRKRDAELREVRPPRPPKMPSATKRCKGCGLEKPATPEVFMTCLGVPGAWCRECGYAKKRERLAAQRYAAYVERCVAAGVVPEPKMPSGRQPYMGKTRVCIGCGQELENTPANFPSLRRRGRNVSRCHECMKLRSRTQNNKRRWRVLESPTHHTPADIRAKLEQQGGKCYWCQTDIREGKYHVDHIFPLAAGGTNGPENICIACPTCNHRKGAKSPQEFANRLF